MKDHLDDLSLSAFLLSAQETNSNTVVSLHTRIASCSLMVVLHPKLSASFAWQYAVHELVHRFYPNHFYQRVPSFYSVSVHDQLLKHDDSISWHILYLIILPVSTDLVILSLFVLSLYDSLFPSLHLRN